MSCEGVVEVIDGTKLFLFLVFDFRIQDPRSVDFFLDMRKNLVLGAKEFSNLVIASSTLSCLSLCIITLKEELCITLPVQPLNGHELQSLHQKLNELSESSEESFTENLEKGIGTDLLLLHTFDPLLQPQSSPDSF
jgi:hypothetical protein